MDVCLIDYGAGNLASVIKALRAAGSVPRITAEPAIVARARAIVVPGVGHFERTSAITPGLRAAAGDALRSGAALFGICLGMQWLFDGSREAPGVAGLGALPGLCEALPPAPGLKIPHVGWNVLAPTGADSRLLEGVARAAYAYFTHSYVAPGTPAATAVTSHGATFPAIVEHGRVSGVQFHPEKSGEAGLQILRNFLRIAEAD
jgi:glutamine amidotransferase